MAEPIIRLTGLTKHFGGGENEVAALNDINIEIQRGEIFGVIGLSGAGKSTLVRCINLLERPTTGSVVVDGKEMTALSPKELRQARKSIGMIFQGFNLLMQRTALDNICFPMELAGKPRKEAVARARELLEIVDLASKENAYPAQLSGGQKQRIAIARTLAMDPQVLLCDEATSALDPKTTQSVLRLLRDINQKLGLTIIVVTHQMEVVREVCDTISILENGKIAASGTVKDIFLQKPPSLMTLLGKEDHRLASAGEMVSFLLPADRLNMIPMVANTFGADILSTNTSDYKGVPFTEVTVSIKDRSAAGKMKQILTQENLAWYAESEAC